MQLEGDNMQQPTFVAAYWYPKRVTIVLHDSDGCKVAPVETFDLITDSKVDTRPAARHSLERWNESKPWQPAVNAYVYDSDGMLVHQEYMTLQDEYSDHLRVRGYLAAQGR
jgi:hypothetical protein